MTTFTASSSEIPMKKLSEVMEVKKLSEFAIIPTRGSQYAAGVYMYTMMYVSIALTIALLHCLRDNNQIISEFAIYIRLCLCYRYMYILNLQLFTVMDLNMMRIEYGTFLFVYISIDA